MIKTAIYYAGAVMLGFLFLGPATWPLSVWVAWMLRRRAMPSMKGLLIQGGLIAMLYAFLWKFPEYDVAGVGTVAMILVLAAGHAVAKMFGFVVSSTVPGGIKQ